MIDEQAPVSKYKNKLGMSKEEVAYNASIVNAHRMFLKSHEEMEAIKAKYSQPAAPAKPIENLEQKLDSMVDELKKELKDGKV